ncbi:hypothetical protein CG50_13745 [Paenirhodobacter enshiensis]|uniref:Uncharacterized protein n=2 Tax=Paenirhodobacter enshiensis TaxID=1105367 RepID=A0A086XQ55_9RHOB|nr:hypothetical protein CG50_13745 [Paenirhodobacter enshiensis]
MSTRVGTISKRLSGHLDWPLVEIMALEDALDDRCVRRWLLSTTPDHAEHIDLLDGASALSREVGEAVSAVVGLATGKADRARVRKEVQDARHVVERLSAVLEGDED